MKAVLAGDLIAQAEEDDLVSIEGNWYFPPSAITPDALVESSTPYTCPWKGEAQYYSVRAGGATHTDRAWSYPHPYPTAFERVGRDFSGYVAFAPDVEIVP